jgi:ABC-type branched-subunit amino acid transport system ATPase component/ABC-type branched-subunit amino acid transport system permease subunit
VLDLLIYLLLSLPLIGAYAMLGVGIVVIFRASRVLNLAHGAMAMFPAYLAYELSVHRHLPMVVVVPVAVASGGLLGMLTERVFVRTLRRQGPTAQTVGTVAMFGLVVSLVAKVWGTAPLIGPRIFPDGGPRLGGSTIFWGDLGLFLTAVVAAGALLAVFKFTDLGLSLRGAADNRVAAALVGIDPDRNARVAWLIGGSLAGVAGVLLGGVNNLSPYTLSLQMLPAFVAALIGGLGSLTGVLVGAACVGALQGLVPAMGLIGPLRRISGQLGLSQLVLTIIALTVMYLRGGKYSSSDIRAEQATGTADITAGRRRFVPTLPVARQKLLGVQIRAWRYLLLIVMLGWPFAGILRDDIEFTLLGDATQAGLYVIAAASIVLLTGWVGQISLAQAAFVGIGAFSSALLVRGWHVDFPLNLLLAGVIASVAAIVLGVVALRVRGLYLAVATLIFAYMADSYLFVSPWFSGSGGSSSADIKPIGTPETKPYFDFSERKTFYFVVLAVAAAVIFGLLNLRDSKTGRAFFAVRGSETAAASLGIDVRRYKLIAFAVAGGIAGVAGNLTLIGQGTVVSAQFNISASLLILAIAVVGGLQSLGGCVAASMVFAGLNELFFRVEAFTGYLDIASAVLLTAVLLLYPGGLAAVPHSLARVLAPLRERVSAWSSEHEVGARLERLRSTGLAGRVRNAMPWNRRETALGIRAAEPRPIRLPAVAPVAQETEVAEELPLTVHLPAGAVSSVIDVRGVRVEFDGLVAVDSADLQVGPGEIVGLIGPNGAGKTTLFNAISGLVVPTSGTVSLFGEDVTQLPVHERARRGLGRTFQAIQLFPQLSVYENLLVATHAANPTGLYAHVFLTRNGVRHEAAAEESVRRAIRFMRLEQVADRTVAGLPFGVLRRVEIARTLVGGWPVIMLDEPASGLDNAETDQLSELLLDLRDRLGVSLLLIEHDVRMVTGVSDRMYVLVHGKMVASGTPDVVREDPTVIAAYLGDAAATTDRTETVPA